MTAKSTGGRVTLSPIRTYVMDDIVLTGAQESFGFVLTVR
jgi:hypothetical protein